MLSEIIRFITLYFCTIYIFSKIIRFTSFKLPHQLSLSLLLTITSSIIATHQSKLTYSFPLLLLWIYLGTKTQNPKLAFSALILSFCISFSLLTLSSAISLMVIYPFYYKSKISHCLFVFSAFFLDILLTIALFKIKRFQKGMPFLSYQKTNDLISFLCISLLGLLTFTPLENAYFIQQILSLIIFIFSFAFLIHWWQAQITKSYKHSLMIREIDSLRAEVEEKDAAIAVLKVQNEELGRLIHHDNKRIPAMENAVCEFLISESEDMESLRARGEMLCLEIESLSRNRNNTLKEIYSQRTELHHTGFPSLDTLLNYMSKRANAEGIAFSVNNSLNLTLYVPKQITVEDLNHLLSDLLENALIATSGMTAPSVQLQFYVSEKRFVIEVADNGIPFQIESLLHFGRSRLTTHAQTGGSGIGLMDIWKIKEKYGATLHIEEYNTPAPFTKKIYLVFNHKNRYSIRSYRSDEIRQRSTRSDLSIYDYEN